MVDMGVSRAAEPVRFVVRIEGESVLSFCFKVSQLDTACNGRIISDV